MTTKSNAKFIIPIVIAVLFVASAIFVSNSKYEYKEDVKHGKLFPDLNNNRNDISSLILTNKGRDIRVLLTDSGWILRDRYNYPVDAQKIRNLIDNVVSIEIVEAKTDNPEKFKWLELEEPGDEEAESLKIALLDKTEQNVFADFIVGKKRKSGQIESQPHFYTRKSDKNQTWLVKANSYITINADSLINKDAYKIDSNRIQSLYIKHPIDQGYELIRGSKDADFKIKGIKKDVRDPIVLNRMGGILQNNFLLGDVLPEESKPFEGKPYVTATYKTFDGLSLAILILELNDQYWTKIIASGTNEQTNAEADAINNISKDWVYRVLPQSAKTITQRIEMLVKEDDK